MKKLLLISLCILPIFSFSQNIAIQAPLLLSNQIDIPKDEPSTFFGIITDEETGEPLPFVNVVLVKNGVQITGATSDFDGNFFINELEPGEYIMKSSSVGYEPHQMSFKLNAETKYFYDCKMEARFVEIISCCFSHCCRLIVEEEPLPITDLFAEQDSIEQAEAASGPPTSVDESSQPLLKVFPNPVQSVLTISGISGMEQLQVLDLSGKLIKQISLTEVPDITIDVASFTPGIYLIKYEFAGKHQIQKFVKH